VAEGVQRGAGPPGPPAPRARGGAGPVAEGAEPLPTASFTSPPVPTLPPTEAHMREVGGWGRGGRQVIGR
jgi:hypothetical protein